MQTGKPTWWEEAVSKMELQWTMREWYTARKADTKDDSFRSIVGQQISVLAADSIWARLVDLVGEMEPENILKFTPEQLAKCGITGPKSRYIHGIAQDSERFIQQDYQNMSDKEAKKHFISFKQLQLWKKVQLGWRSGLRLRQTQLV